MTVKLRTQLADSVGTVVLCAILLVLGSPVLAQESGARGGEDPLRALPFVAADALKARKLSGFKAEVAHLVFAAEDRGEIALEAAAQALPSTGSEAYVPLLVEIDGLSFLSHNQATDLWLEIYAYVITSDGSVAGHLSDAVALDVAAMGEELARGGLKLFGHLELPRGEYQLRVLVRNPQSGAFGLTATQLEVAPQLVAIFPESEPRWLAAVESHAGPAAIDADYPFVIGDRAFSPAARPVITGGRSAEVLLLGLEMGGWGVGKARFLTSDGDKAGSSQEVEIAIVGPPRPAARGLEALTVQLRPPELPAGEYRLVLELSAPERGAATTSALPVWLTAGDVRDRDLLWTDLRWMIDSERPAVASQVTPAAPEEAATAERRVAPRAAGGRQRKRIRRAAESYRTALATLSSRPLAEGREVLFELESDVLGRGSERLAELRVGEVRVAQHLAEKDPESLIPLLAVHLELYRTYRARRLSSLLSHSRLLLEAQAEIFAAAGGSATLAADVLASLGGELQQADLTASSQRLFGRALQLDPANLGALLGLAISFERYSRYQEAVATLERLVESHPEHAEGRLRLAINLGRLGLRRRSLEMLEALADADKPTWVAALTYQQLGRRYLETGSLEQAERFLLDALQELPSEPGTRLMLAYVYDRQRRPLQSLELLREVQPSAPAGNGSAVKIYDGWPREVIEQARRRLAEQAEGRRDVLAKWVSG